MKKMILLLFIVAADYSTFSQIRVEEFDYPVNTFLTQYGYYPHEGGTTNSIKIVSGNLSYTGYPSQGSGNMIQLIRSGQDVHDSIGFVVTSGTIYASMLVNVDSAQTPGDFFFLFGPAPIDTLYRARTLVKRALNGNLSFGINKATEKTSIKYSDSVYSTGITYLLVAAYKIVQGSNNDTVKLWINPPISPNEPPTELISAVSFPNNEDINVGTFAFRQGHDTASAVLKIDGLRIDTTWQDVIIPVELVSLNTSVINNSVELIWSTASERNNMGFDIERKTGQNNFEKIGFVNGKGTTSEFTSYFFVEDNLPAGVHSYRLKQIDFDGSYKYSKVVEAEIEAPSVSELKQNYPNPFNPSTSISFNLAVESKVSIKVYNLAGEEMAEIVKSDFQAGIHNINFNTAQYGLNSGVYFYKIVANSIDGRNFSSVKKMILIK
jgi:hypothetical protein